MNTNKEVIVDINSFVNLGLTKVTSYQVLAYILKYYDVDRDIFILDVNNITEELKVNIRTIYKAIDDLITEYLIIQGVEYNSYKINKDVFRFLI